MTDEIQARHDADEDEMVNGVLLVDWRGKCIQAHADRATLLESCNVPPELRLGFRFTHLGVRYVVQSFRSTWSMDGRSIEVLGLEEETVIKQRMKAEQEQKLKEDAVELMRQTTEQLGKGEEEDDDDDDDDDDDSELRNHRG